MKSQSKTHHSHDAISGRAKTLWEAAGRPDGDDLTHWLQAEKELNEESADSDGEYTGTSDEGASTTPKLASSAFSGQRQNSTKT